jgi:sulfoxide reductase heme-binding subunit YedZ
LTSTHRARRALGRSWRQLHRLIYPATVLAWLHLLWLSRSDWGEALVYGAVLGGLLAWRVRRWQH